MAKQFRCELVACVTVANPQLLTHSLFDANHRDTSEVPIDQFLRRLESINKLAPRPGNDFDPYQAQLVLLGAIAAVESFLRAIFRRLIAIDQISQESVNECDVSFGAAMYLSKELMPEAILERIAFVSEKSIKDALRELLGVSGNIVPQLSAAIDDYVRVCQLRHCAVHRFGKLGVRNAIALGFEEHKKLLEKPLLLDYASLQCAIAIAIGLVKTLNNFLFNEMLSRIPAAQWTNKYTSDRALFLRYYNLFRDRVSSQPTAAPSAVYKLFRKQHTSWVGRK